MKLATFETAGSERIGAVINNEVVDLQAAYKARYGKPSLILSDMQTLIEAGDAGLDLARTLADVRHGSQPLASVRLLAPVPVPVQIRDCLCFELHLKQAYQKAREVRAAQSSDPSAALREMEEKNILAVPPVFYQRPIYYKANRFSVIGTDTDVIWPSYSELRDFELEFGFFTKGSGADIAKGDAAKHIFGYTIFNDFSARDEQVLEMSASLDRRRGRTSTPATRWAHG